MCYNSSSLYAYFICGIAYSLGLLQVRMLRRKEQLANIELRIWDIKNLQLPQCSEPPETIIRRHYQSIQGVFR